ncbi:MAG: methionine synthase [Oligoflexia bacterium]|nr:methionine synthase [Oligoflexia bacterium]
MSRSQRVKRLTDRLSEHILVLDGAMGTAIQDKNLSAEDFGGPELEGCNENLVVTRPEIIASIHKAYLDAGADILETNTFGGTPIVLGEFGLSHLAHKINFEAARLARAVADQVSTPEWPRFVAGSIGPTTKAISVTGGITFEELIENFYVQAKALYEGGVDYFLLETCQDTRNIKAGLLAIERLLQEVSEPIPTAVSVTIEPMGTMLAGQSIEALQAALAHKDLLYIGLNCATGPEFMTDHIRSLAAMTSTRVACVPNAGLPDEDGKYIETPAMIGRVLGRFCEAGWINLLGGCCGTTAPHIAELRKVADRSKPRLAQIKPVSALSGIDYLEITDDQRPIIVGERTNLIGSRKFKRLIEEDKFEEAAEIARSQVRQGAQIVDICFANPDRNELADIERFLQIATKMVRVPFMIDSTDEKVIAKALTYCQGKAIINSINLEDGEERFEKVIPLARSFGAALVVGTIDEDPQQGMGVTRERKLEIATRSYRLLTEKYGVLPEDIYWDPLVFPCATGDAQYVGSAVETIEGIRLIKERFPGTRSVLGISNVSFGLPADGREVLNSVFLYHCVQAGLDLAIVNSEKLERYASIPEEEKALANALIFECNDQAIAKFTEHFRQKGPKTLLDADTSVLTAEERLSKYIVEGTKEGLFRDLDFCLENMKPLDIINGPLMKGMDEVGRLFNNNELIVAEVLQSAESMKAAVSYLEPHMDKTETTTRGKVVLATVKGDVHDIGKNLVDIILTNNGFKVINLGIKIPPEQLLAAVREHKPDIIGLSGLLVKSAQQMVLTAQDLQTAGVRTPILVGGAALTESFTYNKISPAYGTDCSVVYAKDAMQGLDLAKQIIDPERFQSLKNQIQEKKKTSTTVVKNERVEVGRVRSPAVNVLDSVPKPPDFNRHVIKDALVDQIWNYVNPRMLYGRHLGLKGSLVKLIELEDWKALKATTEGQKALELVNLINELKGECRGHHSFKPQAIYQFFEAASDGNYLHLYSFEESERLRRAPAEPRVAPKPLATFDFPRQQKVNGLCLSDYVNPLGTAVVDNICLFVVTAGRGIREWGEELKDRGQYLKSHAVQAFALETAEAFAEYLHTQIRNMWGFADPATMSMLERFQGKYRGRRYSFGYPACPVLDDQAHLFRLLKPKDIGVELTEGFMMDPEASVSALVFHHPAAIYYGVGEPLASEPRYSEASPN